MIRFINPGTRIVGRREFAADASIENHLSHAVHRALGFQETERVVFFRKPLDEL